MNSTPDVVQKDLAHLSRSQNLLKAVGRLLVLGCVLGTVGALFARTNWAADLLANLRIQLVIAALISLACCLVARDIRAAVIGASCVFINLIWVVPAVMPPQSDQWGEGERLRLMTINVLSSNRAHQAVIEQIQDASPDAVAVLELTTELDAKLTSSLGAEYPFRVSRPDDRGNFGIALFSRLPMDEVEVFDLGESIPSIAATIRGVHLVATHPFPPMGRAGFGARNTHLMRLAEKLNRESRSRTSSRFQVVMGDLNLTPWSPIFGDFVEASGLRRAHQGLGIAPTWYARREVFPMGLVLDHVLISSDVRCERHVVGEDFGSDHRSVFVDLSLRPE